MNKWVQIFRQRRNECIWRFAPSVMLHHYHVSIPSTAKKGNDALPTIGILRDPMGLCVRYITAAEQLGVPYKLVDLWAADWLQHVRSSGCDLFFVWPSPLPAWKLMCDERISTMEKDLGLKVYPSGAEIWPWESKRRMGYWMESHDVRHPKTWVFYDYDEALSFVEEVSFPVVYKPDFGDCGIGVRIVRQRREASFLVKQAFRRGVSVPGRHPSDRTWGSVIFQEYIEDAREWRVMRVGDSCFAYEKGRIGDYHSGTKLVRCMTPPQAVLEFGMALCDKGKFDCMSIDILEKGNGELFALEIQSLFGVDPWVFSLTVNGVPGRYRIEKQGSGYSFTFERGVFCENGFGNLRIRDGILKHYGMDIGFWEKEGELERCLELGRTQYSHLLSVET